MAKTQWKDASKERPQEGQAVLVASFNPSRPTDIICNTCRYEDGRFWEILEYKGREPATDAVVIDCRMRYEVQNAMAWRDAIVLFREASKFFIDDSKKEA